jgi:hypothetical protein
MRLNAEAVVSFCGCQMTAEQPVITPERAEAVTRLTAYVGAKAVLLKRPETRPAMERARNGFCTLKAAARWDIEQMAMIAAECGLDELRSDAGTLVLVGGTMLLDLIVGKPVDLSTEPYAKAVVVGACDGLNLAVGPGTRDTEDATLALLRADERATRPKL